MLTADQIDALVDPILELYERYQDSVIQDIARRLAGMNYARPMAAWQMQRLSESGALYASILDKLAVLTGKSESELRAMFEKAGVKAMKFDDAIYRAAGLNPLPLNLSPAMAQVLAAGLNKTNGLIKNLTMTTAISGQNAFLDAADLAYMQVSSGAMSYTDAIVAGVKNVAAQGLDVIQFPGRRDQLDVAMRRAILTGVSQTTGELQIARADEMGQDLVQTSAHIGARNTGVGPANHEGWQGRIFSRSGNSKKYPGFIERTGYGTGPGLCGWNCRHSFYPFFEGISENAYTKAELDSYAAKTVKYNGEEISFYDATQKQRAIERKIRYWKRQAGALEAAGLENTQEIGKVREWQGKMRDFTKQTGLIRQGERERVIKVGSVSKVVRSKADQNMLLRQPVSAEIIKPSISLQDIQSIPEDRVLTLGNLNKDIVSVWTDQLEGNLEIVLTGKQRAHFLKRHPEMAQYEGYLVDAVFNPLEVHRNKEDEMMAIFYKYIDENHYLRTAILMQKYPGALKHSIISYRIGGIYEIENGRNNGRMVWRK